MAKFLNTCLEETIDLPFLKVKREKYSHLPLSSLIVWSCCFCRVSMIGSYDHQIDIFCLAHYFFVAKNVQNERVQKVVIVTLWPILCYSQRPTYHEHCTHGGHFYPISIILLLYILSYTVSLSILKFKISSTLSNQNHVNLNIRPKQQR